MDGLGLSIYEQVNPISDELNIIYTPNETISHYSYKILKNGETYENYEVTSNSACNIKLTETGKYQIIITAYDINENASNIESGFYNIDVDKPIIVAKEITLGKDVLKNYKTKEDLDVYLRTKEIRIIDDDSNLKIETNLNELDLDSVGNYTLDYTVTDRAGNVTSKEIDLNIVESTKNHLGVFQYGIIIVLLVALVAFLKNRRSVMYETRLSKYSVNPMEDTSLSVLDIIINYYHSLVMKVSKSFDKSVFLEKYSRKYEKYIVLYKSIYERGMDLVANKALVGVMFLIIALVSKTLQFKTTSIYELVIIFTFGFFVPDIVYISKYKIYRRKLENDIFQAIIIMNNAFKSGRSISQAIDLVSKELDGQVALEFEKMSLELSYGLGVDVVFKRLAERVNLEEVNYLTASLSILNRTGGNIIKVFSSIEKTLFNKKKLKLELASLTGSSKIIAYMLFAVPFLFIIFISIVNPSYFKPLYETDLGRIIIGLMIIIYIGYVFCVRKLMKVRM